MKMDRKPISSRSAWRTQHFPSKDAFSVTLSQIHLAALHDALNMKRAKDRDPEEITQRDFMLMTIAHDIAAWREEVLYGRGFIVLRGFPVDGYTTEELATMFWGLATHFGRAVSQNQLGQRIVQMKNEAGKDPMARGYRSSCELRMHTDRCDVVAMCCIRSAMRGGVSGYASAHTIYNELLATQPELLDPFFEGFYHHRFGEQALSEAPVTPYKVPILSECQGELSVVFTPTYVEMGATDLSIELGSHEQKALHNFERLAYREDIKLMFTMEPGEVIFFNNCLLLHNRTDFEDHPNPLHRRHLLRLWLMLDGARPLHAAIRAYKGTEGISIRVL